MSSIPPNIVGPIAQAAGMQQQASRVLESEREQQATASESASRLNERENDSVGETDNDTRVHTDTEGTGSQGRFLSDGSPDQETSDESEKKIINGHYHR